MSDYSDGSAANEHVLAFLRRLRRFCAMASRSSGSSVSLRATIAAAWRLPCRSAASASSAIGSAGWPMRRAAASRTARSIEAWSGLAKAAATACRSTASTLRRSVGVVIVKRRRPLANRQIFVDQ